MYCFAFTPSPYWLCHVSCVIPDRALVLTPRQHIEYVRDLGGAARQSDRRCNGEYIFHDRCIVSCS